MASMSTLWHILENPLRNFHNPFLKVVMNVFVLFCPYHWLLLARLRHYHKLRPRLHGTGSKLFRISCIYTVPDQMWFTSRSQLHCSGSVELFGDAHAWLSCLGDVRRRHILSDMYNFDNKNCLSTFKSFLSTLQQPLHSCWSCSSRILFFQAGLIQCRRGVITFLQAFGLRSNWSFQLLLIIDAKFRLRICTSYLNKQPK